MIMNKKERNQDTILKLLDDILKEETKIKNYNENLTELKKNQQKLEKYLVKIRKSQKILAKLGLVLFFVSISCIILRLMSVISIEENIILEELSKIGIQILPSFLLVGVIQFGIIGMTQLSKKSLYEDGLKVKSVIINLAQVILQEITKLNELKQEKFRYEENTIELPRYRFDSFLKSISPQEYEMESEKEIKVLEKNGKEESEI